jgi:hypothetical protein
MTIRLRLTLWYTALLGATLILFSFLFYSTLAANLWGQAQQDAARQAEEVANTLTQQLQGDILIVRNNPTRVQFPDLDFFTSSAGAQLIDLNGLILKRSSNLGPMGVKDYSIALPDIRNGQPHRFYSTNDIGLPLLVYSVPVIVNRTIIGAVRGSAWAVCAARIPTIPGSAAYPLCAVCNTGCIESYMMILANQGDKKCEGLMTVF